MFNAGGKTDMLVRIANRNAFIAECKIWGGARKFRDAVDELLGYLAWRDTKAAIVLFIRQRDVSAIIDKADTVIRSHPNLKRSGPEGGDPVTRRDYALHQSGDPVREITVALIPVAIREASD
jgi:hypothetical protein